MPPLTINCYGLVDVADKVEAYEDGVPSRKHLMHAYLYDEGVAGCGGDNVTSLILKNLHDAKGPGGKLVVGMDNCPSQNKNNHLLWTLCAWLVETEYFDEVLCLFLVKGHTNNPADHLFSDLQQFTDNRISRLSITLSEYWIKVTTAMH